MGFSLLLSDFTCKFISLLLITCIGASTAFATSDPRVVGWSTRHEQWTLTAVHDGNGLRGFLATLDSESITGDNIGVLWMPRVDAPNNQMKGWRGSDVAAAQVWLLQSGNVLDMAWCASEPATEVIPQSPESLECGLLESDPLIALVEGSPSPSQTLEVIADAGLGAAPTMSSLMIEALEPSNLTWNSLAPTFQHHAEMSLYGSSSVSSGSASAFCSGCTKVTVSSLSPWTCTATTVGSTTHRFCTQTETRCHRYSGLTVLLCDPCPASNYCETRTREGDTTILPGDPCPTAGAPATIWPWSDWTTVP